MVIETSWGGSRLALWGSIACLLAACGQPDGREGGSGYASVGLTTLGGATDAGSMDDDGEDDDDGLDDDGLDDGMDLFDVGSADDGGGPIDPPDECAEIVSNAEIGNQPADIIIVIDNSNSMGGEIAGVQANMNAFSSAITAADVDAHVVMISGFEHNSDSGICVPPPLGSGMCPTADHNPPEYWRVNNWVGSHSALQRVVAHHPDYAPALRDTAATHVIVITDDNSDWNPQQFVDQFTALDPNFDDFILHAIVNGSGSVYSQLAMQTGGLVQNINAGNFQPVLDALADSVITTASLACEYEIPALEPGEVFDPDKVNVEFSDGAGGMLSIGRVDDPSACAGVGDGWYYDDPGNPASIVLCGQTCDSIQGYEQASVSVIFGCDTIPAG